jgi:ankyrin repeat protein
MAATQPSPDLIQEVVLNAHGNFARVRELIEQEPDLLTVSAPWNETPLQAASHMGNRAIAEWLLDRGAPLDIFAAAMLGRREDVLRLLAADPDLVHARGVHDMPILYFPATRGEREIAKLLVERGADVNDGAGGNTALHAAALFNQPAMVKWLLAAGADRTAVDYEQKTPLQRASEQHNDEVTEILERV